MFLSDVSIKRPVFTTMVTLCLMMLGLLGAKNLGVDLFPDISFPVVSVTTVFRGAGPSEVERLVTKPIEEAVSSINGVDEVRSFSRDSYSTVIIQFKLETDIKLAATDVRDKIAAIAQKLPTDIEQPVIQRLDPTALPILTYAVSGTRNSAEIRTIVEDKIKPKVETVEGVAAVNVLGGLEREIHVFVDRSFAESLGLSLDQIAQEVSSSGMDVPAGKLYFTEHELSVKTSARYEDLSALAKLVVKSHPNGSQVMLSDIATVEDGFKEDKVITKLNNVYAVTFEVQKQGGGNTVAIANGVYRVLDELKKTLPKDLTIVKAVDNSTFIRSNINEVTEALIYGGFMAILVIFIFMLDWRSTFISSLALPTSVVTTFFVMWWLGFSFNMMSLLGLSLAIGLLIDDAVVVRENIYRHMERGADPITAARVGTAEIALAVMATTLAIVAVFVPIAFMSGIVGRMFRQFGLTVAAAVMVSLFVSFTLDPMMSARVVKPVKPGRHDELKRHRFYGPIVRALDFLNDAYRDVLLWSLNRPRTILMIAFGMFVGSIGLVSIMGKEFVSNGDRGEFRIHLELPSGTSLSETERVVNHVEEVIRENPQIRTLFTVMGSSGESNKASIRVYTTKADERPGITQVDIQDDLRRRLTAIPSLRFNLAEIGMIEGPGQELAITLYVRGQDYDTLQKVSEKALAIIKSIPGTTDVDTSYRGGKPELAIVPNRASAWNLGVNIQQLSYIARLSLEGEVVGKYRDKEHDVDIRLQLSPKDRAEKTSIADLAVSSVRGGLVKVSDVATLVEQVGPATIERMDRQRQITLSANVLGRSLGEVAGDIEKALHKMEKPPGYTFIFGGQTQRMKETFSNMGLALFVAIVFIYFVLASQFESFVHPFTIMATLPLAVVGALLMLFLAGFSIGLSSMIGIVLLMGLVTKNAILLVDCANNLREQGKGLREAVLEAGPVRLRPILMTSAAMVLGMLPTAIKGGDGAAFRAPMATAVIGGVIVSTFLTLVVVPVVYIYMDRFTLKGRKKAGQ
ncbi:MAG TPA: efflux RND transporter permease subunit [Myxococcota bacterium]|nr:efflux RND transporter permease subunit [Myxococcota bacterium]